MVRPNCMRLVGDPTGERPPFLPGSSSARSQMLSQQPFILGRRKTPGKSGSSGMRARRDRDLVGNRLDTWSVPSEQVGRSRRSRLNLSVILRTRTNRYRTIRNFYSPWKTCVFPLLASCEKTPGTAAVVRSQRGKRSLLQFVSRFDRFTEQPRRRLLSKSRVCGGRQAST